MAQVFRWAVALLALCALVSGVAALSPVARLQQAAQVPGEEVLQRVSPLEATPEEAAVVPDVTEHEERRTQLTAVSVCAQRGGTCKSTSYGCSGGSFASGLCPGDASIKCCLVTNTACSQRGGSCRHTSVGCAGGSFSQGLCPGDSEIQCCTASSACSQRGGTCKLTSSGCSGSFQAGLCPGASNNQCCLPGGGGGSCGPYANAPVQNIVGNGNQAFGVVKIIQAHLTDPSSYGASPYDKDNTMLKSTACAFNAMYEAARKAGLRLTINSGFRTLKRQEYFWYCYQTKKCNNGNIAARPGTSNHGVGRALDINTGGGNYAWLARNAHSFGFIRTVSSETWHWEHRPGSPPAPYT